MRAHLAAIHRADHVMQVGQRYVDGRDGCSGAQFINTDLHQAGRTNNAKFASTGTVRVTAPGGIGVGAEILMPYGADYWRQRAGEDRRKQRDARRGGMIAYSQHDAGRIVFVEEVVSAREVRGHGLRVGRELFGRLLDAGGDAREVHLLVEKGNEHARALYRALGFEEREWRIWEPRSDGGEQYLVATVDEIGRRLQAADGRPVHVHWEMERASRAADLRDDDRAWAARMYEEVHKSRGSQDAGNGRSIMRRTRNTCWCGTPREWEGRAPHNRRAPAARVDVTAAHMRPHPMARRRTARDGRRAGMVRRMARAARMARDVACACRPALQIGKRTPQRLGQRQRPWWGMTAPTPKAGSDPARARTQRRPRTRRRRLRRAGRTTT